MIGYLGGPGVLQALPYRGGLDTSSDRPVSFQRTLGGKRKAFFGRASRREWGVSFDLIGSRDVAGLVAVSQSPGPHSWYPADAVAGNLLSPQASGFEVVNFNGTDTGLVALPDGSVARSIALSGAVTIGNAHGSFEAVPVRPGEVVSVGGWGLGGIRFTGAWRDATLAQIGVLSGTAFTHSGWGWRSQSFTPPAGAAFVSLSFQGATQIARPTVSWGPTAQDRPGRGAPKAVVHGLSEALTVITQHDAYGSIDVTITEVG